MTNFNTHYRKGFHGQPELWQRFRNAVVNGDCQEIRDIADRRRVDLGNEYRPLAVDPDIFGTYTPDLELYKQKVNTPAIGSTDFYAEAKHLVELSGLRDEPLSSLTGPKESLTRVSWFIETYEQTPYKAGVDFLNTEAEWERIQEGRKPTRTLEMEQTQRTIQTGRDCARFVHDDNPFDFYADIIKTLLGLGVEHRVCKNQELCPYIGRFASVGMPFLLGAIGEVGRRVGLISFREKWSLWMPRPEQYCFDAGLGLLSQTYPEGSPMHPSRNAMHQIIWAAMGGYVLYVFDRYHVLPNGESVEKEIDLLISNGGDWREWAGVHYPSDNAPYIARAKALGEKIAKEHLA